MYAAPGIGLAAIQVGVAKRVVVMDLSKKEDAHKPQVFINPEITWTSEEKSTHEEGCLSIPELLRGGRAADARSRSSISTSTARRTRLRRRGCSQPVFSTRSITSTACCSSTTSPSSSAIASSRNSPRPPRQRARQRRRRWRPSWRSAWCSWARPISPCPRFWKSSAPAMRSSRSIPARRSRPDAAWSCGRARSRARRSGSGCRS